MSSSLQGKSSKIVFLLGSYQGAIYPRESCHFSHNTWLLLKLIFMIFHSLLSTYLMGRNTQLKGHNKMIFGKVLDALVSLVWCYSVMFSSWMKVWYLESQVVSQLFSLFFYFLDSLLSWLGNRMSALGAPDRKFSDRKNTLNPVVGCFLHR